MVRPAAAANLANRHNQIKLLGLANLAQQLRHYKPPPTPFDASASMPDPFRHKTASVLVCLFEDSRGDLRVILTKRSSTLSSHSGEVSLPGGKTEEGDRDEIETALREAKEEIGLDPNLVSVVTVLEPFISKHLYRVRPVVAILHNKDAFNPVLNPAEVDEIFDVPLEMFLTEENKRSEEIDWMGVKYLMHFFYYKRDYKTFVIWGTTASIIIRTASVVFQRPPHFIFQSPRLKYPFPARI